MLHEETMIQKLTLYPSFALANVIVPQSRMNCCYDEKDALVDRLPLKKYGTHYMIATGHSSLLTIDCCGVTATVVGHPPS